MRQVAGTQPSAAIQPSKQPGHPSSPLQGFILTPPHLLPTMFSPHPTVEVLMAGDPLYGVPYMGRRAHGLGSEPLQRQGQASGSVPGLEKL